MANPPCWMIRVILAIALLGASFLPGCDDRSDKSKKAATPAPAARAALPVPPGQAVGTSQPGALANAIPTSRPVIERAEPLGPPPALRLTIELGWDNPYVGEPLPIRLYLSSPRADASINADGGQLSSTTPAKSPLATVGSDWPSAVRFALYQVNDAQLRPAVAELDWPKLRAPDRAAFRGNPLADWEIPGSAALPAGEYLLRVTWDGRKSIETRSPEGSELSSEVRFAIAAPQSDQERAEHGERMALLAYREGRFAETRRLAEDAVKADRQSTTQQRVQMLLAQADACLAMDDFKSGLDVYRSILKMPLDDRLTTDLSGKVKVLEELVATPK
jgi:hypothetical protein